MGTRARTSRNLGSSGWGGRRPGGGRPRGSRDVLPRGTVQALDAARLARRRLGANAEPEDVAALQYVYERVGDVLGEQVGYQEAPSVLKAAGMAADALAGPLAQRVQHSGSLEVTKIERVIVDAGTAKP